MGSLEQLDIKMGKANRSTTEIISACEINEITDNDNVSGLRRCCS